MPSLLLLYKYEEKEICWSLIHGYKKNPYNMFKGKKWKMILVFAVGCY